MTTARFNSLRQWLSWQQGLHPRAVDLGLDRLRQVLERMRLPPTRYPIITVGGTNGKGSCVAFLEAILSTAGYRVGVYTSPHLLRYNERIRIAGVEVDDADLCRVFAQIDAARGTTSLTFFEFGTLAALALFAAAEPDIVVLEVGLGGRLDAVNIVDADVAVITTVDIDHTEYLGPDRDSIGYEKAGIFRSERPAIYAAADPPARLLAYAEQHAVPLYRYRRDYDFSIGEHGWDWWQKQQRLLELPHPTLVGKHQYANAAAALMALTALTSQPPLAETDIRQGLIQARLPARFQIIPGAVEWILDVCHNPQGVATLAENLQARPCAGRTFAVVGMLVDKNAHAVGELLAGIIDRWYTATLRGQRGRSGKRLATALQEAGITQSIVACDSVGQACRSALRAAAKGDRIVVFGSFSTVAAALNNKAWPG